MPQLAQLLADLARPPAVEFGIDRGTARQLMLGAHLVRPGLQRLLDILAANGFLAVVEPAHGSHYGRYRLALPDAGIARPAGSASAHVPLGNDQNPGRRSGSPAARTDEAAGITPPTGRTGR